MSKRKADLRSYFTCKGKPRDVDHSIPGPSSSVAVAVKQSLVRPLNVAGTDIEKILTSNHDEPGFEARGNNCGSSSDQSSHDDKQSQQVDPDIDSEDLEAVPTKKFKKAPQKYAKDWETKLNWLSQSADKHAGFCKVCNKDIKCLGGLKDLLKHAATEKHKQYESSLQKTSTLEQFTNTSLKGKVRDAELQLCAWGASRNKSATEIEEIASFMRRVCTDSDIAKGIKVGRTKATSMITNVLGEGQHEELVEHLRNHKFSLIADESTDIASKKSLALVARTSYWKDDQLFVKDFFYDLIQVTETDSRTLYEEAVSLFRRDCIPYEANLIGLGADGAKNMTSPGTSLAAFLKRDCPSLFIMKCICHSIALCSSYACKHIPEGIEQMCRDIYSYLNCSPLRSSKFEQIQELLEVKPLKMLHPCATRWLSLEAVVRRILDRYDALRIYFGFVINVDHVEKVKVVSIYNSLNDPSSKLYLAFLSYILKLVNNMNKLFQSETPELQILHSSVSRLFRTILDNFFKREYMQTLTDLNEVEFDQQNFECLDNLYVGTTAEILIKEYVRVGQLTPDQLTEFKTNVMRFYITLSHQILKRINFNDSVMKNLTILDPSNVIQRKHQTILPLTENFPNLVPREKIQAIDEEFRELRNIDFSDYSSEEKANVVTFWGKVLATTRNGGEMAFLQLRIFIPSLLALPHSSASVERLFSEYNINKTKSRNRLNVSTMRGILATKNYVKLNTEDSGLVNISSTIKSKYNVSMYDKK